MKALKYTAIFLLAVFLYSCSEEKNTPTEPESGISQNVEIFAHISDYQKLKIIEEMPAGIKKAEISEKPAYLTGRKSGNREIESTECVYYYLGDVWDYIDTMQGVTFTPPMLSENYYAYQWQPVIITFPAPALSVTAKIWGLTYLAAYDEDGNYISNLVGGGNWGTLVYTAPEGKLIKSIVMHSGYGLEYDWYLSEMTVCYSVNEAPTAYAGTDQTIEWNGGLNQFTLDGSGSTDPDGDALSFSWTLNGSVVSTEAAPLLSYGPGSYTFTLTVTDPEGLSGSDDVTVNILDAAPPVINFSLIKNSLWPANHKMNLVAVGISASDNSCVAALTVTVSCNEAEDGTGDGSTSADWEVVENSDGTFDVYLLAERSGTGNGRVYTITVYAEDCAGNVTTQSAEVTVPKSQGNSSDKDNGKDNGKGKGKGKG